MDIKRKGTPAFWQTPEGRRSVWLRVLVLTITLLLFLCVLGTLSMIEH